MMPPRPLRMNGYNRQDRPGSGALKTALTPQQIEKALDPWSMTMPGREKEQ